MAYTYLDITNEVIARMNEVALTSANFGSARGFQVQCKNAVNDAINYVNQREFGWPFTHSTQTQTLVAGQTRYTIPADAQSVDYDTFRISKDDTLGVSGITLRIIDYKEYTQKYIDQETTSDVGAVPIYVFRTPDNNYGMYPYPDKAYELKYEYFQKPTALSAHGDVPTIPEQFRQVIVDGATAYAYQYRGEAQQYGINFARFEDGIKQMQTILLNRADYVRSTYIPYSQRYGAGAGGF
jgi:hypothetical protein|tara:strand:+ start:2671 stop:3387 length:717 start_codon:yes stop_codon:yes gene_type:complete